MTKVNPPSLTGTELDEQIYSRHTREELLLVLRDLTQTIYLQRDRIAEQGEALVGKDELIERLRSDLRTLKGL